MTRVKIMAPARVGNFGSRTRSYGMKIGRRQGWLNKKTGKRTADMTVFTIDGDSLEELNMEEYVKIEFDLDPSEMIFINVDDPDDKEAHNGSWVGKWRDEVIAKRKTGYKQLFVATAHLGKFSDVMPEAEALDHNQLYDISETEGCPAFSIALTDTVDADATDLDDDEDLDEAPEGVDESEAAPEADAEYEDVE